MPRTLLSLFCLLNVLTSLPGAEIVSATADTWVRGDGPGLAIDGDPDSRWSAEGDGRTLTLTLDGAREIDAVAILWFNNENRSASFELAVSQDGRQWTHVLDGQGMPGVAGFEIFHLTPVRARHVRFLGHGNSANAWNSVQEIQIGRAGQVGKLDVPTLDVSRIGDEAFQRDAIVSLMRHVNEYTRTHPYAETDRNWIRGTYYTGVMGLYRTTGDDAVLRQAMDWGEKHGFQVGGRDSPPNKFTCVQTWTELYQIKHDPKMLEDAVRWVHSGSPTSPVLGHVWYLEGGVRYADSLYVAPPAFARLYRATRDPHYLRLMDAMFWDVKEEIYDPEYRLFYRDKRYFDSTTKAGKKVFWARGNGWVHAALARILEVIPGDHDTRPRYLRLYREMAGAIAAAQPGDGLWRSNLADPEDYSNPETSGTAFFTFSLAWGINAGILDASEYLPVVQKGWRGLVAAVQSSGKLGWVQPVGGDPRSAGPNQTHEYAVGLFLLAGEEMVKLADAGYFGAEGSALLPPGALRQGPMAPAAHPLHEQINTFLARPRDAAAWTPSGLARADYLDVIEGQTRAMMQYQDEQGRIIDPVEKTEKYYSTPCFAHAVAVLSAAGRGDAALREAGMRAMDAAVASMAAGNGVGGHGDFFTWPLMLAFHHWTGIAPDARVESWREGLGRIDPRRYRSGPSGNNWNLVNTSGEYLRHREGMVGIDYVDKSLAAQRGNFTRFGMYVDPGQPPAYDVFSRHYLGGMLQLGYAGEYRDFYRETLWKGAWTSLFAQSPSGELPTGYRSAQHIWNEAELCVVFELYASAYAREGRMAEAGAFKRAARLALGSVREWIRPDGTGYAVKNRYPIDARHGYEQYTSHACYNMLACSMLAQAWQFADESIAERAAPADTGGFVFEIPTFHKIIANAGGAYVEYDTRGDQVYDPTGLLRVHLRGGNPVLGPSGGCGAARDGESLAVGPSWKIDGTWTRLAALQPDPPRLVVHEATPRRVRFDVEYSDLPGGVALTEKYTLEPTGVTIEDALTGDVAATRISFPALVFDGESRTDVTLQGNVLSLALRDRGMRFEITDPKVNLERTGKELPHRNGMVEEIYGEANRTHMTYRITPLNAR